MTPEKLSTICNAFDRACSLAPDIGEKFYQQLSSDYPEMKIIFNSVQMEAQHTRFIGMLRIVLNRMNNGQPVTALLQDLGRQHHRYGVRVGHFEGFGDTMMTVLDELLGSEFDDYMRDAWAAVYGEITRAMQAVGHDPR